MASSSLTDPRGHLISAVTKVLTLVSAVLVAQLSTQAFQRAEWGDYLQTSTAVAAPLNASLWRSRVPRDNRMSQEKVILGRALYFDKRLSRDGTLSCAGCHDPAAAFTDSNRVSIGILQRTGRRNVPTLLNVMFSDAVFWDGRAASLEEQVKFPLLGESEMAMPSKESVVARVSAIPEYRLTFKRVFKSEGLTFETITKAIAAYERTLLSGNAPFDPFVAGKKQAITESQRRGWELFKGKAQCIECHVYSSKSPFFTDFKFHNTGIAISDRLFEKLQHTPKTLAEIIPNDADLSSFNETELSELGRFTVTRKKTDIGAFKTPTLRDIELTSPYMHDGSIKTLIDVVRFYDHGGTANAYLDQRMRPLHLTDAEMNDLVEFLRSLTSDDVLKQCETTPPQNRNPVALPR